MMGEDAAQEDQHEKMVNELNDHAQKLPLNIAFPVYVSSDDKNGESRTKAEFVNLRLLESGVLFEDSQAFGEATAGVGEFIHTMRESGCYDDIQVLFKQQQKDAQASESSKPENAAATIPCSMNVMLKEKKWYKMYVGGGVKHESLGSSQTSIPKVQFETNATLLNTRGVTDSTTLSYSIDQTGDRNVALSHDSPLFSIFPEYSTLYNRCVLAGTQTHFNAKAGIDMDDFEWSRSYRQFNRGLQFTVSNRPGVPEMLSGIWKSLTYSISFRDIIPRRHPTLPYACNASPDVVSQSGPSLKHSLKYTYQTNGEYTDSKLNPTNGFDYFYTTELSGPPGDTGFLKVEGGGAVHFPLFSSSDNTHSTTTSTNSSSPSGLVLHASLYGGIMRAMNFQGLCHSTTCISDRFFSGGPLQLRGFQPSGIGARANTGGKSVTGGDALGGEIYYNANIAASVPSPFLSDSGLRLFGFVNAGTLSGCGVPMRHALLKSSRLSVGAGACVATPMGRLEVTYAIPLRYGPKDARKNLQLGCGFTFN